MKVYVNGEVVEDNNNWQNANEFSSWNTMQVVEQLQ